MPLHQVSAEQAAKTGRQIGALSDTAQHFLPPGMDMVLDFITKAMFPETEEDVMQQMSDSVLADLALGIITPSQGRTAREFIENTLEAMSPGVKRAQSVENSSDLLFEILTKHGNKPGKARQSEFVVPPLLQQVLPDSSARSPGRLAFMVGESLPGQGAIRPFSGVNPKFTGKPNPKKAQMVLEDLFFKRNPTEGIQNQNEVLTHELGHLVDQSVGRDVVEEITSDQDIAFRLYDAIKQAGQPDLVRSPRISPFFLGEWGKAPRAGDLLFSEGIASLLQIGEKLPRALTNKIPELAGLESFIDSIVFGGGR